MERKKIALISGATGAIGKSIAHRIAMDENYHVTLVARSEPRVKKVVDELIEWTGNEYISYAICDLSRKHEIKALAESWDKPLHLMVNDAAVTPKKREETPEGIEKQWATNVLGYFWMIKFFSAVMQEHAPARIVNVASYWAGGLDIYDPEFKNRSYNNDTAYRQSKQANRMITAAFAQRLRDKNISVNACHPGDVRSTLASNLGYGGHETPHQGAETPVWLATSAELSGITGRYFEHKQESKCRFGSNIDQVEELFRICESY